MGIEKEEMAILLNFINLRVEGNWKKNASQTPLISNYDGLLTVLEGLG